MTIIVDANLLIHAYNAAAPQHDTIREWLEGRLRSTARIGLPWQSLLAFLRITTHPRLFPQAAETSNARRQVEVWLSSDAAWIPQPTEQHLAIFSSFLDLPGIRGGLVARCGFGRPCGRARLDPLLRRPRFRPVSRSALGEPAGGLTRRRLPHPFDDRVPIVDLAVLRVDHHVLHAGRLVGGDALAQSSRHPCRPSA